MPDADPGEALNASYWYMEITGFNVIAFREMSGIGSENDVILHHQTNKEGKSTYVKTAGKLSWQNLVLKKGIDADMALWEWRQKIIDEGVDGNKKDGTIYIVDVQGTQKSTWSFVKAWPCSYVVGAMVPDTNEMLLEEIHLAHEGLKREQT